MDNGIFTEKPINNENNKQNIFFRIFKLFIWIIIISLIITYFNYTNYSNQTIIKEEKIISIDKGETINELAQKLDTSKLFLKKYIKNNNPDFILIVGDFKLKPNSKIEEVLKSLKTPIIYDEINITFLEGWNIYDIDEYLSKNGYFEKEEYINYVTNSEKIEALSEFFPFIKGLETLEGYLYPDTYKINIKETQINQLVIRQLENLEERLNNSSLAPLLTLEENLDELHILINLASIVEKEEKNPENKTIVAGILKKRLDQGWMIGADATVCYPHKLTGEECKLVVSKYINEVSDYNTRTMAGLPKTPIGNPSLETITATYKHKKTPYYFYLHNTSTGEIYFAKTNAEHEANKRFMK